jgi:uracil phosphoribosyltransferase
MTATLAPSSASAGKTTQTPGLRVIYHPVVQHKLSVLRDKETGPMAFRQIIEEVSQLLAYEATGDLKTQVTQVETPMEKTETEIVGEPIVLVAVMRAGVGMLSGMLKILPFATAGHIGIYRDKFIKSTVEYYLRLPKDIKGRKVLLLDPLLATGDTAVAAIDRLKEHEAGQIRYLCILASPQGIEKVRSVHPDVEIFTFNVERGLDERGYLLPGVGDAGDRLYDTVQ